MIYLAGIYLIIGTLNGLWARKYDWKYPVGLDIWIVEIFIWPVAMITRIIFYLGKIKI